MTLRFEYYKVKRNDNLGDPNFWNPKFQDIDLRLASAENQSANIANATTSLISVGLQRLNDTFTPLILEAQDRLNRFGAAFSASSSTSLTVGLGAHELNVAPEFQEGFIFSDYLALRAQADPEVSMLTRVESYDRLTGLLTVTCVKANGAGTFNAWDLRISAAPDLTHEARTDNPHSVTAAQVGAYTIAQSDAALAAHANDYSNPHEVTAAQIGAATPALIDTVVASHANNHANPHATTAAQVGAYTQAQVDTAISSAVATALATAIATAAASAWTTGDAKLTLKNVADAGWVMMNDSTIGDAASGAVTRANADCQALFTLLWTNIDNTGAPVVGGRGVSAAADWAAHKKITLTRQLGRALAIAGAGAGLNARTLGHFDGNETHTQTTGEVGSHTHGVNDPGHSHIAVDPVGHIHNGYGVFVAPTGDPVKDVDLGHIVNGVAYSAPQNDGQQITQNATVTINIQGSNTGVTIIGNAAPTPMDILNPRSYWNIMIKL